MLLHYESLSEVIMNLCSSSQTKQMRWKCMPCVWDNLKNLQQQQHAKRQESFPLVLICSVVILTDILSELNFPLCLLAVMLLWLFCNYLFILYFTKFLDKYVKIIACQRSYNLHSLFVLSCLRAICFSFHKTKFSVLYNNELFASYMVHCCFQCF